MYNMVGKLSYMSTIQYKKPPFYRYYTRTGHYSERDLADKIYRNRNNLGYCRKHGIRMARPALGRTKKNLTVDKNMIYMDAVDRIEVERKFSLLKRCYGLGLIWTKHDCCKCRTALPAGKGLDAVRGRDLKDNTG